MGILDLTGSREYGFTHQPASFIVTQIGFAQPNKQCDGFRICLPPTGGSKKHQTVE